MQRWLTVVFIASLVGMTHSLPAQEKTAGPNLGGRLSRFREEQSRAIPPADFLIYQRAQKLSRQRAARLEAYRWMGYSPNRPTVSGGAYATNLNPGLYKPWVTAYFNWDGR